MNIKEEKQHAVTFLSKSTSVKNWNGRREILKSWYIQENQLYLFNEIFGHIDQSGLIVKILGRDN